MYYRGNRNKKSDIMRKLKKLKLLLVNQENYLNIVTLLNDKDYTSFEMTKESFLDVFEIRLEICKDMANQIKGLEYSINSISNSKYETIISHSIDKGNILIYTDIDIKNILGFIDFR